jgi:hypothetical protein
MSYQTTVCGESYFRQTDLGPWNRKASPNESTAEGMGRSFRALRAREGNP